MKYVCQVCGFIYDPEVGDPDNGVAPGTPFEELPEDWVCPLCIVRPHIGYTLVGLKKVNLFNLKEVQTKYV